MPYEPFGHIPKYRTVKGHNVILPCYYSGRRKNQRLWCSQHFRYFAWYLVMIIPDFEKPIVIGQNIRIIYVVGWIIVYHLRFCQIFHPIAKQLAIPTAIQFLYDMIIDDVGKIKCRLIQPKCVGFIIRPKSFPVFKEFCRFLSIP